jgi:hypothetical protein
MSRIKPYQDTSQARLSELIRKAQSPALSPSVSFIFSTPLDDDTQSVIGGTTVTAMAKVGLRTDPALVVKYKRLGADVLWDLPAGELHTFEQIAFPTSVHAALPIINRALGLDLLPEEVVNTQLLTLPENGITITITNNSLAWLPGNYLFSYAPKADERARRGINGSIPTDERKRIRVLESVN